MIFNWRILPASNLRNRLAGPARDRELADTCALYEHVRRMHRRSPLGDPDSVAAAVLDIVAEACSRASLMPIDALAEALCDATQEVLLAEGIIGFPEIDGLDRLTMEEGVALRAYLARKRHFLEDSDRLFAIAREKLIRIFEGVMGYLPSAAFDAEASDTSETGPVPLTASLVDLCEKPREAIERIIVTMHDADVTNARLFEPLREQFDRNVCVASGIPASERRTTRTKPVWPTDCRIKSDAEVASLYLGGTGFASLFAAEFPFHIPFATRFEHAHVVGGSGHGKTQLLQLLIERDLKKAEEDGRSVVVIDSQGDLIRTISRLSYFAPGAKKSLADRLVLIDPTDVEYPACLNMFDVGGGEAVADATPLDREKILNSTIELYEYFFGALLGAELTQKQGVIFKYLARLMLQIPGATIHTFRQLMEDGEPFRPYMRELSPSARSFFETRFFDRSFNETKKQVLTRLWGVLSNATFERMFSHPKNKVDLFAAMNDGKIILINTAKDLLQQDGSAIFGRFFIALIAQGAVRRSALPPHERRPTFVYIDEAADYFDDTIGHLLNQARKYKVGMVLAHQNLDQLTPSLRSSIAASTSIKLVGGVNAKDASAFAAEMQCDADFIQGMKKGKERTAFACYVRNLTPHAIGVAVPLGSVEKLPTLSAEQYAKIVEENRKRYCAPASEIRVPEPLSVREPIKEPPPKPRAQEPIRAPSPPPADEVQGREAPPLAEPSTVPTAREPEERRARSAPAEPPPLGRGGKQHKYLQHLFKQFAEERGFRAVIEEPILNGSGRVDLALSRGDLRIACEISVTTGRDHELGNVEKCLAAGYSEVVLVGGDAKNLAALKRFIAQSLDPKDSDRVRYFSPEEFLAHVDARAGATGASETVVRGYKVKVRHMTLTPEDVAARRATIAKVIARSLGSKGER